MIQGYGVGTSGGPGDPLMFDSLDGDHLRELLSVGNRKIHMARSGVIDTGNNDERVQIGPNTTFDGNGFDVTITGRGFKYEQDNVIVGNLRLAGFTGPEEGPDNDILQDAHWLEGPGRTTVSNVIIHHCDMSEAGDKAIMVSNATNVTLAWNRFHHQTQMVQIGCQACGEGQADMKLTVHSNLFEGGGVAYRQPVLSYGYCHAFNNVLQDWGGYGMGSQRAGKLFSERNIFEAGDNVVAIKFNFAGDPEGYTRDEGSWFLNDARARINRPARVPNPHYNYTALAANQALKEIVIAGVGPRLTV